MRKPDYSQPAIEGKTGRSLRWSEGCMISAMTTQNDRPDAVYTEKCAAFVREADGAQRAFDRLANLRLAAAAVGFAAAAIGYYTAAYTAWWGLAVLPVFAALMAVHERVNRRHRRATALAALYAALLERMRGGPPVRAADGEAYVDPNHLYALDVDLVGPGGVFQRINLAQTAAGERALVQRLTRRASIPLIRDRQDAAAELRPRHDLREKLELAGQAVRAGVHPDTLAHWAGAPAFVVPSWAKAASVILPILAIAAIGLWIAVGVALPFWLLFAVNLLVLGLFKTRLAAMSAAISEPGRELKVLANALRVFETETFAGALLQSQQARIRTGGVYASACVARLDRIVDLFEAPRNAFFAPFAIILMWPLHTARMLEAWRVQWGPHVAEWTEALGELEALLSIAAYAYECPDDPFPALAEQGPLFDAKGLAHPLLGESAVRNDLRLESSRPLLMLTGSNMSGKSTLLRSIGVAAAMAMAGAPVRARFLALSPMAIGSNIRVHDSIQEGKSRFYAEIVRLKELMAACNEGPLLFLLDELLHGTNSHDRRIGAEAVIRALIAQGAVGLVTSHDLALADMVGAMNGKAENVHLQDDLRDGALVFDYTLKPGVVQKSNALALMQAVGLPIGPGAP